MRYHDLLTKAFISYHHENDQWAKEHLVQMAALYDCFKDVSVNTGDIADDNRSSQSIRELIRDEYLRDAEVTILLCGSETQGRKHVDWELKSSMIDTRLNKQSGVLVVMLPSVDNGNRYCSMYGEKQIVYPDVPDVPGAWVPLETKTDFESWWPALPDRIIDNMIAPNVRISIVPWDRISGSPDRLKWLVDNAARAGRNNDYDLRRKMQRANSPRQYNALARIRPPL